MPLNFQKTALRRGPEIVLTALCIWTSAPAPAEDFQGSTHKLDFEKAPVLYTKKNPSDPVDQAARTLRANRALGWKPFDKNLGYLPAVLEMLGVPPESQMLVFSKTSLQRQPISPENPRALYFSDTVYVGYIPGAPDIEVAAVDPELGTIFYTVHQDKDEPVRFRRSNDCLQCHASARSMGVPGFVLRSLDTDAAGEIIPTTDTERISHCTPFSERWGGWFVSDAPAEWPHRGNAPGVKAVSPESADSRIKSISTSSQYPVEGSDTLALLVHDHQTHMHNYITRLHMEGLERISEYGHVRYLEIQIRAFLRYLLFTEEAKFPAKLEGSPSFREAFQKNARRDSKGRSLKDFDLTKRLFRYPCSFLIDSDAFRKLPQMVRDAVLARLHSILTGRDSHPDFQNLDPDDLKAVLEILKETAPDLTAGW
jgi:hypothetical protein